MWPGAEGRPRPATPSQDDRLTYQSPGPPPWDPPARLTPPTVGCLGLVALAAVGAVVSLLVALWRLIDRAADL